MIPFKNNGFTLIEALIAMVIIALSLTPILFLQTMLLRMVDQGGTSLRRILQAQTFLISERRTASANMTEAIKKTVEHPHTQLNYEIRPLNADSTLKVFKNVVTEKVVMQWSQAGKQRSDSLMCFLYKPEKS